MANKEKKEIVIAENRDFKGVWIPERLYLTREFTPNEKFLLIEIYSLTKKKSRECFANNKHFADFVGLKENTVQKMMLKFENAGYIKRDYEYRDGTKEIERRTIKLTQKFYEDFINETEENDSSADDMENNQEGDGFESTDTIDKNPRGDGLKVGEKYSSIKYNNDLSDINSSDTDNSFSEEKDIYNSPFPEMEKSVRKELMPIRAGQIAYRMYRDEEIANNVKEFVDYFLKKRREKIGETHTQLKDTTLHRIVATIINPIEIHYAGKDYCTVCEPLISEFSDDSYKEIVDAYFEQKFKMKIDYSLPHFAQNAILTTLMMKVDKDKWCTNEQCGFMED